MKVFYAEANYGDAEIDAAIDVLKNQRLSLMGGPKVTEFEQAVAMLYRKKMGVMTNSGSSANLLALLSLELPKGTQVITPSLTFSTTVAPIVQAGLVPLFLDIDLNTLQIDAEKLDEIDTSNVSAIMVPNLIGNLADWGTIGKFAVNNGILSVEDSADTIGYEVDFGIREWADITTTSFYASHVVTGAGFGGMATFSNKKHYDLARSYRGWGRRSSQYGETEDFERRFNCEVDGIQYDDKYVFDDLGFNFIPSDISAAFGLIQLEQLSSNIKKRMHNFDYLKSALEPTQNFTTFGTYPGVKTGWLAFPLMLSAELDGKRSLMQEFLEKAGIQTRTIFTGNIIRQPVAKKFHWEQHGEMTNADKVMKNGILVGCHDGMSKQQLDYIIGKLFEAEKRLT